MAILFAGCRSDGSKQLNLNETYSQKDKNPFGGFIAYKQIEQMYSKNTIREKKESFYRVWSSIEDKKALYISISLNLFLTQNDADAMISYIEKGNELFLAAAYFDENLIKQLGVSYEPSKYPQLDQYQTMDNTLTTFAPDSYGYYYQPFSGYFFNINKSNIKTIATNENGKPNCIVIFRGKGKIFLHCDPRVFSNYFLLQKKNYQYLQQVMAYTNNNPEHLYWDDYYRKLKSRRYSDNGSSSSSDGSFSTFDELFKHPPLKTAFWLFLLLLLLYFIFGSRRRQRIIKPVKPNVNTTVAFTETIGRLYLQKKDNKNIADKMITYFNEYVRNNYFLNTNNINAEFISTLSRKSNVPLHRVEILYRAIAQAQYKQTVSDFELLALNEQIQQFYKKQ
jgi:hypothetical protein